ncbi:transposase [Myxococcus sp. XM-1-1-1]|nr:transposase [Myxococcus sp. AS-1-15]MBZ4407972.1 transposase [Myxococcus sp. XM-1-1-1]
MGRLERRRAMEAYLTGLLLDGERKSVEPMASRLVEDTREVEVMRQRLQQCVSQGTWSDEALRERLARTLETEVPELETLVVDDTGFPKKGQHSVGWPAVLGHVGAHGQLPGGRQPASGRAARQRMHRHAAVPARGPGHGHSAAQGGRCARDGGSSA